MALHHFHAPGLGHILVFHPLLFLLSLLPQSPPPTTSHSHPSIILLPFLPRRAFYTPPSTFSHSLSQNCHAVSWQNTLLPSCCQCSFSTMLYVDPLSAQSPSVIQPGGERKDYYYKAEASIYAHEGHSRPTVSLFWTPFLKLPFSLWKVAACL